MVGNCQKTYTKQFLEKPVISKLTLLLSKRVKKESVTNGHISTFHNRIEWYIRIINNTNIRSIHSVKGCQLSGNYLRRRTTKRRINQN